MGFLSTKSPFKSTMLFGILSILSSGVSLLLLPIFLNYLSPEDYGIISLIIIYSSVVVVVGSLGLKSALYTFHFDFDNKEMLQKYLSNVFSLHLISFFVIVCIHLVLGNKIYGLIFVSDRLTFYNYGLIALLSAIFRVLNSLYFVFLKNEVNLKIFIRYSLSTIILVAFFQLLFVVKYDLKIYGMLLGTMIPNLIIFLCISFSNSYLFTYQFKKKLLYPSLNYSLKLLPFLILFAFENQIDKYLIELKLGLKEVGLYALLIKLFGLLLIAMSAMDDGIRPFLYSDLKEKRATSKNYFNLYIGFGVLILVFINTIGLNLGFIFKSPEYFAIKEYFLVSSVVFLLIIPVRYYGLLLVYYKASTTLSYITAIKIVVTILFMLYLIPTYQLYGALYALGISYLLNNILFGIVLAKNMVPLPNWKTILFVMLFLCASYLAHSNLQIYPSLPLSIVYMILLVGFFILIYYSDALALFEIRS